MISGIPSEFDSEEKIAEDLSKKSNYFIPYPTFRRSIPWLLCTIVNIRYPKKIVSVQTIYNEKELKDAINVGSI